MWDKGINGRAPEGGDFTKRSQACYTLSNSEWEKGGILFLQPRYQTGKAIDRECAGGEMLSGARSNHRLPCILLPGCGGRQTTTRRRREKIKKRLPELGPAPGRRCCQVLLANDLGSVHGDHELLIGGDEQHLHLGVGGGDDGFLAADVVGLGIHLYSHELQAGGHGPCG